MGHPVVVFLLLLLCMWFYVSEWFKNLTVVVNHTWLFVDGYTQCQDFREFYYWVSCTVAWLFEDEEFVCVRRIRELWSWPKDQPRVWCATRGICTRQPQRRCWWRSCKEEGGSSILYLKLQLQPQVRLLIHDGESTLLREGQREKRAVGARGRYQAASTYSPARDWQLEDTPQKSW